jgi:hypothetical protein
MPLGMWSQLYGCICTRSFCPGRGFASFYCLSSVVLWPVPVACRMHRQYRHLPAGSRCGLMDCTLERTLEDILLELLRLWFFPYPWVLIRSVRPSSHFLIPSSLRWDADPGLTGAAWPCGLNSTNCYSLVLATVIIDNHTEISDFRLP